MTARDDGESIGLFEPLMVSEGARSRTNLNELASTLLDKLSAFSSGLTPSIASPLADLVRIANCHYSNRIESHFLHPIAIEQAINNEYSDDEEMRALQLEARAHVNAQRWIDESGKLSAPFSVDMICDIHRRIYEGLPRQKIGMGSDSDGEEVLLIPGAIRTTDVQVGRHIAVSPGSVPRFLARMVQGYRPGARSQDILQAVCGHHRLLWVHPFLDGNGRVARLVTHAALDSSLDMRGSWPIARGLALREKDYKAHLQACDEPRRGSLDGRGTLSEGALAAFAEFFLQTCIEQVDFVSGLTRLTVLLERVVEWARAAMDIGTLPPGSDVVLVAILRRGELRHDEIATLVGADGSPSLLTSALIKSGICRSLTPDAHLTLAFPVGIGMHLFPGLLPED